MPIDLNVPLATLVNEEPARALVLEEFGLDYCCGGRRSLAEACDAAGLDTERVAEALESVPAADPAQRLADGWAALPPAALADHIESTHHVYLQTELPRLAMLVEKVVTAHGANHPELHQVDATYAALVADLEPHLLKEERVLFPLIREMESPGGSSAAAVHCGTIRNPISVMRAEHDREGELLARLHELTSGYRPPADACLSYRMLYARLAELERDTHLHIHKENNVLFPAVVELEASVTGRP